MKVFVVTAEESYGIPMKLFRYRNEVRDYIVTQKTECMTLEHDIPDDIKTLYIVVSDTRFGGGKSVIKIFPTQTSAVIYIRTLDKNRKYIIIVHKL